MDACITTTAYKTHVFLYFLFSWKTNPVLRKLIEQETCKCVCVCEFTEMICWWEGVDSLVSSQGVMDMNDVAYSVFCVWGNHNQKKTKLFPSWHSWLFRLFVVFRQDWTPPPPITTTTKQLLLKRISSAEAPNGKPKIINLILLCWKTQINRSKMNVNLHPQIGLVMSHWHLSYWVFALWESWKVTQLRMESKILWDS